MRNQANVDALLAKVVALKLKEGERKLVPADGCSHQDFVAMRKIIADRKEGYLFDDGMITPAPGVSSFLVTQGPRPPKP